MPAPALLGPHSWRSPTQGCTPVGKGCSHPRKNAISQIPRRLPSQKPMAVHQSPGKTESSHFSDLSVPISTMGRSDPTAVGLEIPRLWPSEQSPGGQVPNQALLLVPSSISTSHNRQAGTGKSWNTEKTVKTNVIKSRADIFTFLWELRSPNCFAVLDSFYFSLAFTLPGVGLHHDRWLYFCY